MGKSLSDVLKSLSINSWLPGAHLFGKKGSNGTELESGDLVNLSTVIGSAAELDQMQGIKFKDVFNTWKRIALNGSNPNAVPAEIDTWTYDDATDTVHSTVNSASTVGFISPNAYDNYTFEVDISSGNGDDDAIGLCLAYIGSGSSCYSLCLYRQGGSNVQPLNGLSATVPCSSLAVIYQPGVTSQPNFDSTQRKVAGVVGNMVFPDGTKIPATGIVTNGANGGWNVMGTVRLKVVRTGNVITIQSTNGKSDMTYDPANNITIDLSTSADLQKFMGPCQVGFIAYSQPDSSFKSIQQPGVNDQIIDARDNSLWTFDGTNWNQTFFNDTNSPVKEGRIYKNAITGASYYVARGYNLIRL
jgi:hypothetical protein